ncbi:MAG: GcrA family cell cycle regulator [Pseudolabrys sp.]
MAAPICAISLKPDIRSQRGVRVGATSSCRRPSLAASTGHEANMTATETSSKNLHMTWTAERVDMLRSCVSAGLSCAQIAHEIGVSRNAVIGKINRLGLSRGRNPAAPRTRVGAPMRRPQLFTQRLALKALFASEPVADYVVSTEPCSLLNLAPRKCRWPISAAGTAGFAFCGNTTAGGVSYCAGHARMAYRFSAPRARVASSGRSPF